MARRDARRRWVALVLLALAALPLYLRLRAIAGRVMGDGDLFLAPGVGVTLIAVVAAALMLATRPADSRRGRWIELALLAAGGLAFRAAFLGAAPALSHDAYRYVWDAQLVAHGVSPYTHTVVDPTLAPLRDAVIWPHVSWRDAPTLYPPGAQALYLLVHVVAPLDIGVMQVAMALCDLLCGALTVVLLRQRGLDPRRAVIYWWNPIPVLEFSFSAHVDAAATLWVLAAVALAGTRWRYARVVVGALLGLAVMTKLYPLLFVAALMRRRDWGFATGLGAVCLAVAAPFVALGLGSGGFVGTYFAQRFVDQGLAFRVITTLIVNARAQLALQALGLLGMCALVMWPRLRQRGGLRGLDPVAGILALSAGWILLSPHLFPWYVGGLLPLLALVLWLPRRAYAVRPSTAHAQAHSPTGQSYAVPPRFLRSLLRVLREVCATFAILRSPWLALWLFVLLMPFTYVIFAPGQQPNLFLLFFAVPLALAAAPLVERVARHVRARARAHAGRQASAAVLRPFTSKE